MCDVSIRGKHETYKLVNRRKPEEARNLTLLLLLRSETPRQSHHEDRPSRQFASSSTSAPLHERPIRRSHPEPLDRESDVYKARQRPRTHHYVTERPPEPEVTRPRPRSFYESPNAVKELRGPRHVIDPRDVSFFPLLSIRRSRIKMNIDRGVSIEENPEVFSANKNYGRNCVDASQFLSPRLLRVSLKSNVLKLISLF